MCLLDSAKRDASSEASSGELEMIISTKHVVMMIGLHSCLTISNFHENLPAAGSSNIIEERSD